MDKIIIRGARENNLKNINIDLPKNKLIENNNMVDLYYIDGSINEEYVNDLFSVFGDKVNTNIIKNKDEKIIQEIDNKINSVKKNTYKNNMSSN